VKSKASGSLFRTPENAFEGNMNNETPVFSLIIPFFNAPGSDRREMMNELESSIPDRSDLEVIWVNDHSRLEWSPSANFLRTRVKSIRNTPERRYAGTARNTGLDHAAGTFVLFGDSDDLFRTDAMNCILDRARDTAETDLILFRVSSFLETGGIGDRHNYITRIFEKLAAGGSHEALLRYYSPTGKILRRGHIDQNGLIFGDTKAGNDVIFSLSLALSSPRVTFVNETGYDIRQGNPSLTTIQSPENIRARIQVARDAQLLLRSAKREDLAAPMHYILRRFFRQQPLVVFEEAILSVKTGARIFSSPRKIMRNTAKKFIDKWLNRQ